MTLQQFKRRLRESLGIKTRDSKGRFIKVLSQEVITNE